MFASPITNHTNRISFHRKTPTLSHTEVSLEVVCRGRLIHTVEGGIYDTLLNITPTYTMVLLESSQVKRYEQSITDPSPGTIHSSVHHFRTSSDPLTLTHLGFLNYVRTNRPHFVEIVEVFIYSFWVQRKVGGGMSLTGGGSRSRPGAWGGSVAMVSGGS